MLRLRLVPKALPHLSNIIGRNCHELSGKHLVRALFVILLAQIAGYAQIPGQPPRLGLGVVGPAPATLAPAAPAKIIRQGAPPPGSYDVFAVTQEVDGPWRRLRGKARIEFPEYVLQADEVDFNEESNDAEARGHVYFKHYERNEEIWADKAEYNFKTEQGKFYEVHGKAMARIEARPGVLATSDPFYFEGKWADKLGIKYILHQGMVTNCKMPQPWWTLTGPTFDIVPNERAIAHKALFRVRKVPLFYMPLFYKSLEREPRKSGFLAPNVGNSSRRGKMFGIGYYWAINRSYDVTYRIQDFTQRGIAHHVDIRGKPWHGTDFNLIYYGVDDRGLLLDDGTRRKEGGHSISAQVKTDLGNGFYGQANINYLSSLVFRQAFTESFTEAVFSESNSTGFIGKQWSYYSFNAGFARLENFQSTEEGDRVLIRKLPEVSFQVRDRKVNDRVLPLWFSMESNVSLLSRSQPLFQTRQFVDRLDFSPRVMTAIRWKGFHLLPSFSVEGTHWGESQSGGRISGDNINRMTREVFVDLITPSFERTFRKKTFLGEQLKHVIEPRATFRHVSGVADFDRFIRFDTTELLTNTTEAEVSLTQRFFAKRNGDVREVLTWELWQRRYFDPNLGGAVVDGRRNVVDSQLSLTPYAFFDVPRNYSPVVSAIRASPVDGLGVEWRTDYDPLREQIVNSSITVDMRRGNYFVSAGHAQVRSAPVLSPNANQFRSVIGFGNPNHRGWNAAFSAIYDFRIGVMQFATTQVTYNTDCCGLSFQYRRFGFGTRNENQFRVAFAVANIGTFGTLKKQERFF